MDAFDAGREWIGCKPPRSPIDTVVVCAKQGTLVLVAAGCSLPILFSRTYPRENVPHTPLTRRVDGPEQQLDQDLSCGWRDNWYVPNGHEAADVMRPVSKVLHDHRLLCGRHHQLQAAI